MNVTLSAVGFDFQQEQQDLINKKLERISYAEDLIVDLLVRVKEDKKIIFDVTANFRWGASAHVSADDYDFGAALNKTMDILDTKIKKEKDKIQKK